MPGANPGNQLTSPAKTTMKTTTVRKLNNASFTCPFCGGSGHLPHYSHIQNGGCFACGASGELDDLSAFIGDNSDLMLTVYVNHGVFSSATLRRRTWRMVPGCSIGSGKNHRIGIGKEWGRDSFVREISDAEEARKIWRNAKQLRVLTELVD